MRTLQSLALAVTLLVVAAAPARADGFFTPFYGFNYGGDSSNCAALTSCQDKRTNFGFSFGKMGSVFGFEEDVAWAQDFYGKSTADNSVFSLMSNLLIGVGAGPVRPYMLVGTGLIRPHTSTDVTKFSSDQNALGYDIGGGVNAYFSKHVGIRGDVRHLHTLQDVNLPFVGDVAKQVFTPQKLDFWRATIGVSFK